MAFPRLPALDDAALLRGLPRSVSASHSDERPSKGQPLITAGVSVSRMRTEAASAGFCRSSWGEHPKVQVVTVGELLEGRRLDTPPLQQADRTFRKAPREAEGHEALRLELGS